MQILPSHSQRQLISGKVGWGWRQATYPISTNFGFAGFLMLSAAIAQLVQIGEPIFLAIAGLLLVFGFWVGLHVAKSVIDVCRQNSDYVFSQSQLIVSVAYWLVLVAGISLSTDTFIKIFVAIWWVLPAAIFLGISSALVWRSAKGKNSGDTKQKTSNELTSSDILNIVTYSDQTVLVSPSSLGQQPRQFNSFVLILLGLFFWTMLDLSSSNLSNSIRATVAIAFTVTGLTGFFTWQTQLRSPDKILQIRFSGLWGMSATYAIDLRPFSRLAVIKLQEAGGELSWMQLAGSNKEITLPLAITMFSGQATGETKEGSQSDQNDQLGKTIRTEFHLAKQETERDSLGLAHVLLPQGAGILAGAAFIGVGGLLLFVLPLPAKLSAETAIAWLGVCIVSPAIARFFIKLVAPNSLQSDRLNNHNQLQPWEIGTALLLISASMSSQTAGQTIGKITNLLTSNQSWQLLTLICGWLSISIGVCILAFVRRTPLWNKL
ncbi:MAG: hypothetical protein WCP16_22875 [Pseudanabaena sp. ELA645]|jgi:hypothetical protein